MPSLNIKDSSGKGGVATIGGDTLISSTKSKFNSGSYYFDGTGDYISFPDSSLYNLGSSNFTIDFWMNTTSGDFGMPISRSGGSSWSHESWNFRLNNTANKITFMATPTGASGWDIELISSTSVNDGEWHHVAAVRTGNVWNLHVDGILEDTDTQTFAINAPTCVLTVGATYNLGTTSYASNYTGYLDEVRITPNRALWTTNFLPPVAAIDGLDDETVLLIHGDDDIDVSHSTHTISNTSVTVSSAQSKLHPTSFLFNGTTSYLSVADSSNWDFVTGDFTIETWFKRFSTGAIHPLFFRGEADSNGNPQIAIVIGRSNVATEKIWVYDYPGGGGVDLQSTNTVSDTNWHHLAVVRSSGTVYIYIDGIVNGSASYTTTQDLNKPLWIGRSRNSDNETKYFAGHMDEFRVTKGIARWTADFIPPVRAYPNAKKPQVVRDDTKLLLHMTGENNATATDDYSIDDRTVTFNANAKISTTQSKFGGSAAYFDGTGDYISLADSADWDFGSGLWTVELSLYTASTAEDGIIQWGDSVGASSEGWKSRINSVANKFSFHVRDTGEALHTVTSATSINDSAWHDIAVVCDGTTIFLFVDGIVEDTTAAVTIASPTDQVTIGALWDNNSAIANYTGYLDEIRITKGIAKYSGNFAIATEAFPTAQDPSTKLLLHMKQDRIGGTTYFKDSSPSQHYVFPQGDAALSSTQSKFGSHSLLLDGTGDKISSPNSNDWDFGSSDFTIEFWVRQTVSPGTRAEVLTIDKDGSHTTANYLIEIGINSSDFIALNMSNGSSDFNITGSIDVVDSSWHHVAVVRDVNTLRLFIDGATDGTVVVSGSVNFDSSMILNIGGRFDSGYPTTGNIDEIRITKGIARWTAAFTPSTLQYPDYM